MQGYNRVPTPQDTDQLGARIGAVIIDGIIATILQWIVSFLLLGALVSAGDSAAAAGGAFSFFVVPALIGLGYWILFEGLWDGYTPGKKLLGIKVVKEDGSPIDMQASLIRNLLRFVDALPAFYILGLVLISSSDISQRLGDRVAGTVVVTDSPAQMGAPQQQGQYQQQGRQQGQYQQGQQQGQYQQGQQQGQYQQGQQGGQQRQGGQQNRRQQGGQQRQGGQQNRRQQGGQQRQGGNQNRGQQGGQQRQGDQQGDNQNRPPQGGQQDDRRNDQYDN